MTKDAKKRHTVTLDCLIKKYDSIYDRASVLFDKYKPCEFDTNGSCIVNRSNVRTCWSYLCEDGRIRLRGCCSVKCKYLTTNGCSTRSLGCKLYMCEYVEKKYPELYSKIRRLRLEEWKMGNPNNVYHSKEDWIRELRRWRTITLHNRKTGKYTYIHVVCRRIDPQ